MGRKIHSRYVFRVRSQPGRRGIADEETRIDMHVNARAYRQTRWLARVRTSFGDFLLAQTNLLGETRLPRTPSRCLDAARETRAQDACGNQSLPEVSALPSASNRDRLANNALHSKLCAGLAAVKFFWPFWVSFNGPVKYRKGWNWDWRFSEELGYFWAEAMRGYCYKNKLKCLKLNIVNLLPSGKY